MTSLAVSFLRLIFGGNVVASIEFGGKLAVVELIDGVNVEFAAVVVVVDGGGGGGGAVFECVRIEIGVDIDVFGFGERN